MTKEFRYLLALVGYAAQGKVPPMPNEELDWNEVLRLSREQSLPYVLSYALDLNPEIPCPQELKAPLATTARNAAFANVIRTERIMRLLQDLEREGISAKLVKGTAIAEEYAAPEYRVSGDADIWIDPENEKRACELLEQKGFQIEKRWKKGHHAVCHHPQMGCVELHVMLYDEIVEDIWFANIDSTALVSEEYISKKYGANTYYTLGITDHLIFVTLHMIKHFILKGMSLRMMLDVAIYLKNHKEEVDLERYLRTLRELRFDRCAQTIFGAMVEYAGFSWDDFPGNECNDMGAVEMVLQDLEVGGCMGFKDKEKREQGWTAFAHERMLDKSSKVEYYWYMVRWQVTAWARGLFPKKSYYAKNYPYAIKHPILLPVAWIHRFFVRGLWGVLTGRLKTRIVVDSQKECEADDRINLFRELEMM